MKSKSSLEEVQKAFDECNKNYSNIIKETTSKLLEQLQQQGQDFSGKIKNLCTKKELLQLASVLFKKSEFEEHNGLVCSALKEQEKRLDFLELQASNLESTLKKQDSINEVNDKIQLLTKKLSEKVCTE